MPDSTKKKTLTFEMGKGVTKNDLTEQLGQFTEQLHGFLLDPNSEHGEVVLNEKPHVKTSTPATIKRTI